MSFTFFIQNYKCFKDLSISFGKVTVLAGSNSVGKSSVIQSLLLLRTARDLGLNKTLPLIGPFLLELGSVREVLWKNAKEVDEIKFILTDNDDITQARTVLQADRALNEPFIKEVNIPQKYPIGKEAFYYLNAERIGPRMNYHYASQKFPHVGYKGEATFQLLLSTNKIQIDSRRALNISEDNSVLLLREVKKWLEYILPGSDFENAISLGKSKEIEASINENLPTNVGFGISYALPIIVNGLIAEEGSMLIVENPEAHLHPSGQSRIGRFLARVAASGVQVVVETHSEHVINGIRIATLVTNDLQPGEAVINFFSSEKGQPKVKEILVKEDGDLTDWPVGFFDQEQRDFAEMTKKLYGQG